MALLSSIGRYSWSVEVEPNQWASKGKVVQKEKLNIRPVTKDKLIGWFESVCYLLDTCSVPLLQKDPEEIQDTCQFKWEKIDYQITIIDLQKVAGSDWEWIEQRSEHCSRGAEVQREYDTDWDEKLLRSCFKYLFSSTVAEDLYSC